tara:strand:+ start:322 stop:651 length:330 start_codon:yes stop_codon:yes gene_type:complete
MSKPPSIEEAHVLTDNHARGLHLVHSVYSRIDNKEEKNCPECYKWPAWKVAVLFQDVYSMMGGECVCGYHYDECDSSCCPEDSDRGRCLRDTMTGLRGFMDEYATWFGW